MVADQVCRSMTAHLIFSKRRRALKEALMAGQIDMVWLAIEQLVSEASFGSVIGDLLLKYVCVAIFPFVAGDQASQRHPHNQCGGARAGSLVG
jgi:hypothetical protein